MNKLGDDTLKNISDDSVSIQQQETAAYLVSESNTSDYDNTEDDEEVQEKKLSGELAKIFRKYREMPGLESQLVELFESLDSEMNMNTSSTGNILISGN